MNVVGNCIAWVVVLPHVPRSTITRCPIGSIGVVLLAMEIANVRIKAAVDRKMIRRLIAQVYDHKSELVGCAPSIYLISPMEERTAFADEMGLIIGMFQLL